MRFTVLHPFLDKYHPEDIFYPGEIVKIEDTERINDLMELELLGKCKDETLPCKELKAKEDKEEVTVEEIKQILDKKGIKYDKRLSKEKLVKLLEEAE